MPAPAVTAALDRVLAGERARDLEHNRLDFKTVGRSREDTLVDLAEAAACLANGRGGHLVVGVADGGRGPEAFVGSDLDEMRTQRRIYELTQPGLIVTVSTVRAAGADVTVIAVPRSPDVHQVKGRATERIGSSCEPMTAQRIATVLSERRGDDWSSEPADVSLKDVSTRAEEELRARLAAATDDERARWATLRLPDILRRLGLLTPESMLNRAGEVLLVGRTGAEIHYTHRKTRSGSLTTNEVLAGPALVAIARALELVEARNERTPVHLPSGQQLFVADLPDLAVREAVVNAAMHRDYQVSGAVQIEHADTRLAVTSPGGFVSGVTPENILTTSSKTRNLLLANAARALGLAETAGVGVDRMYASMAAVGHRPPVFATDGLRVSVELFGGAPNAPLTRFVASMEASQRADPDTLLVLLTLLTARTTDASQLSPTLQKAPEEVETTLRHLGTEPVLLLERTPGSATRRFGTYRLRGAVLAALGPAVQYHRRTGDESDRKVIDIVRETGQVNGRLVRSLLDVAPATASRIISDLVDRGVLVKTSQAQRGPSVTYGRGPRFPGRAPRTPRGRTP